MGGHRGDRRHVHDHTAAPVAHLLDGVASGERRRLPVHRRLAIDGCGVTARRPHGAGLRKRPVERPRTDARSLTLHIDSSKFRADYMKKRSDLGIESAIQRLAECTSADRRYLIGVPLPARVGFFSISFQRCQVVLSIESVEVTSSHNIPLI